MQISDKVSQITPSASITIAQKVKEIKSQGTDVIGLHIGEPDFLPPKEALSSTREALLNGKVRYSNVAGEPEVLTKFKENYNSQHGTNISEENLLISNGSKASLYVLFQTICNPGDEVILFSPYWITFPESIALAGAVSKVVETDDSCLPKVSDIEKSITDKTKVILLNSPSNPSGRVYPDSFWKEFAEFAKERDLYIISDEAYIDLYYSKEKPICLLAEYPHLADRLIITQSFSKSFALTGFRLGVTIASTSVIKAMNKLQGHLCGNNCTFSQYAINGALDLDSSYLEAQREEFKARLDVSYQILSKVLQFDCPEGAFYLFPKVSEFILPGETDVELCRKFLEEEKVAILPGSAFGKPGHVRISFTADKEVLRDAMTRFVSFLQRRKQ